MKYERYHASLVFSLVLFHLLKGTDLENKALYLYADIVEIEAVPEYHIKTARKQAIKILNAYGEGLISAPSPFTKWQRMKQTIKEMMRWRI